MTPAIQKKLDKVFNLYNDNAAKETKESEAALNKLQELCKKHKVDFDAFMSSKGAAVETTENTTSDSTATVAAVVKSRRGFIISLLKEGIWDRKSIAEAIAENFPERYVDLKKNSAAVTGTINDLRTNKAADITVCDATGRILYKVSKK